MQIMSKGRPSIIKKTSIEKLMKDLTPEQREFAEQRRVGKTDPVYFAETLLGLKLHDAQKLWLWMTTGTQRDKACELGIKIHDDNRKLWTSREEFDKLVANIVNQRYACISNIADIMEKIRMFVEPPMNPQSRTESLFLR